MTDLGTRVRAAVVAALAAALGCGGGGSGGGPESLCAAANDCVNGSSDSVGECQMQYAPIEEQASAIGCGTEFSDVEQCTADHLTCTSGASSFTIDVAPCASKGNALFECAKGKDDCLAAYGKNVSCGVGGSSAPVVALLPPS